MIKSLRQGFNAYLNRNAKGRFLFLVPHKGVSFTVLSLLDNPAVYAQYPEQRSK
jgi:hypothetical protein